MLKILITSCDLNPEGWRAQNRKMHELYALSDRKHDLTNDPEAADFILVCDAQWGNFGSKIRENIFIKKFPNKCFILSNQANPYYYARGILTNAEKGNFQFNRFRSCSYTAYYDPYHNPFVQQHNYTNYLGHKEYLFSFIGRDCHPCRNSILHAKYKRDDILVKNTTKLFDLWSGEKPDVKMQQYYYDVMLKSKFVLCPRGSGANSIRLFESMKLGISPVIISDDFALPHGPNWREFAIIAEERDSNKLETILEKFEDKYANMGALARKNYELFFDEKVYFNYIIDNIIAIDKTQVIPEEYFHRFNDLKITFLKQKNLMKNILYKLKS